MSKAIDLCERLGHSPVEAAEKLGGKISWRTIYRALEKRRPKSDLVSRAVEMSEPVEVPADVRSAAVTVADADKARAIRRLVWGQGGGYNAAVVEALAVEWGCSVADIQVLVLEASIAAGRHSLPFELAREESIEAGRRFRQKCEASADWKTALLAQAHIDRLQLPPPGKGAVPGDGFTRAQVVTILRRLRSSVRMIPGALAALDAEIAIL